MKKKTLEKVTDKEINEGRAYIEIGFSPRIAGKDLRKIMILNRRDWVIRTGKEFTRTWYCNPKTIIYIKEGK